MRNAMQSLRPGIPVQVGILKASGGTLYPTYLCNKRDGKQNSIPAKKTHFKEVGMILEW